VGDRSVYADGVSDTTGACGVTRIARSASETDWVLDVARACELLEREGNRDGYLAWWSGIGRSSEVMGSVTIFIAVGRKT
jgi:hypothetical protein